MKKWNIGWGLMSECNMKCKFCYSKKTREECGDLNYSEWVKFIDNNHNRINTINYGTGENTLSKDWFQLVKYISNNYPNIVQSLTTNGYLSKQVKKDVELFNIVKGSLSEVDISLDFCDEEMHNKFRGQRNAFKWAIDSLGLCEELCLQPTIVFLGTEATLYKENIDGLFEIAKRYNAKLRMNIYRPTDGINDFTKKFIVSYTNLIETLYYINEKYRILSISDSLLSSVLTNGNVEKDPSGTESLRILSDGSITPSTYLISENFRKYNIKQDNVLAHIEEDDYFANVVSVVPKECEKCPVVSSCKGGVYDRRFLWYSSFKERDPYCPYRKENFWPEKRIIISEKISFTSVHHGYLPTIFFSN